MSRTTDRAGGARERVCGASAARLRNIIGAGMAREARIIFVELFCTHVVAGIDVSVKTEPEGITRD